MKNIVVWGVVLIVLFVVVRKLFGGNKETDTSMDLMLDVGRNIQITESQFEKVSSFSIDTEYLVKEGFVVVENTPHKTVIQLEKENYNCEYTTYYELEGRKVKKVVSQLTGEWKVGKKTKSIKGATNDPYQKWMDFDGDYEEAIEREEERLFEIEQDKLDSVDES